MAAMLKLVRLNDFTADIDTVDLLSGGFSLAADGYAPVVAPIGAKSVHETITLTLKGTSTDDLAFMVQDIDRKIKECQWWIDDPGVEKYQVWLRVQMDGETYTRQAQILNIEPANKVNEFTKQETNDYTIVEYTIGIERTPFWEQPYSYPNTTSKTALNVLGDMVQLSETIQGDVPARLAKVSINQNDVQSQVNLYWAGWKTSRFGNPANFTPVWSLNLSSYLGTDTSASADTSAYNGNKVVCTFGTDATLISRAVISVGDVISDAAKYNDQRGTYLVLLRAYTGTSTTVRARMAYSFGGGGVSAVLSPIYRARQVISNTNWSFYEMGLVSFPAVRSPISYTLKNSAIEIDVERIAGSGSLTMDCLTLIPVNDGALKSISPSANLATTSVLLSTFQNADESLSAIVENNNFIVWPGYINPVNSWSLPANNEAPYLVIASQGLTGSPAAAVNTKGWKIDFSYNYIPRWRTLRGTGTYGT